MREKIKDARRVVVKLGSNLFFDESGNLALHRVFSLVEDLAAVRTNGRQVIVVSSGAVALGANALKMKAQSAMLEQKQAFAAVGQSRLMNLYEQAFGKYVVFSGEYIWKYTHNAYDFSVLGATPITFPIEWNNSKIPGYAGRISVPTGG